MSGRILDISNKVKKIRDNNPVLDALAGFIPGVGEAQDFQDFVYATKNKDYLNMAMTLATLALPGSAATYKVAGKAIGNAVEKIAPRFIKKAVKQSDNYLDYLPKGVREIKVMPDGRHLVATPEGKNVIAEIVYKDLMPVSSYGFNAKNVSKQALEEFNDEVSYPFLSRKLQENKYADAAQAVIDGTSKAKFTTGQGRLLEPDARDVLTAEVLGDGRVKTVGYLGTKPIQGKYRSSGKFGNFSSITNTPNLKYGYFDFEGAEYLIKNSGLNAKQQEHGLDLIEKMKEYEDPKLFRGKDTVGGNLKLGEEETEKYLELIQKYNKYMSDLLSFGTRNHRVVADAPSDKSIVTIISDSKRFGDQLARLDLDLIGLGGIPLPALSAKRLNSRTKFNNILDAERTVGGWNDSRDAQAIILKNDKNLVFPLHVKGIGPNPVNGMTTLQVDNIHPSLKQGGYVTFYKRFKNQN